MHNQFEGEEYTLALLILIEILTIFVRFKYHVYLLKLNCRVYLMRSAIAETFWKSIEWNFNRVVFV